MRRGISHHWLLVVAVLGAFTSCALADEYLYLSRPSAVAPAGVSPGIGSGYDSDEAVRYVCYDGTGTIEAIVTQQGHDALLPSCPAGDTALRSDMGEIGDRVSAGQITTGDGS